MSASANYTPTKILISSSLRDMDKVRTIKGAIEDIRRQDPATPLTASVLRRWILSGALPAIKSGNKYLINMEVLARFLEGTKT